MKRIRKNQKVVPISLRSFPPMDGIEDLFQTATIDLIQHIH
jgi:hypothetical protein